MTIDDWRARYDGLSAEAERLKAEAAELRKRLDVALFLVDALRARVTPEPIVEKHKDGKWRLVWSPKWWAYAKGMPPAPEVKNDAE